MKATAVAPANIAFIKYWGRKDAALRIPSNPSVSMNLSSCTTTTTVEFSRAFEKDTVSFGFTPLEENRILSHIDRLRKLTGTVDRVAIATKNSFPKSAGIASSASGFAALTVAAATALGLRLSQKELTSLARLGSGSACRSIPDGFVKWEGEFAYSLYPAEYWDLRDILVIVEHSAKNVSSSAGHDAAHTSPYFEQRLQEVPKRILRLENALRTKNFQDLGEVIEEDCLDMHHVMQTQNPPLQYFNDTTRTLMQMVPAWRKSGLPVYFTIDAGPNVHLICEANVEGQILKAAKDLRDVQEIIVNKPARGTHII